MEKELPDSLFHTPQTGVGPNGAHARQTPVYWWWLRTSPFISCHLTCQHLAWSASGGSSCGKETTREEIVVSRAGLCLRSAHADAAHGDRANPSRTCRSPGGLQQHVFAAGREAEEIRALWRAAHQKVLLEEPWLHELLSQQASPRVRTSRRWIGARRSMSPASMGARRNWRYSPAGWSRSAVGW